MNGNGANVNSVGGGILWVDGKMIAQVLPVLILWMIKFLKMKFESFAGEMKNEWNQC